MLLACSTEKNAWVNRAFHNVNSRYNGYYHAEQSLEEGIYNLKLSSKDDLNKLIPVFQYGDENSKKGIYGQMDKAIEKATKVVAKHSMIHKVKKEKREVTNWVDNSYLVIGKAYFFKSEYGEAHKIFEYVVENFDYMENSPIQAKMWDIQTYIAQENYTEAYRLIKNLEEVEEFPKESIALFNAIKADYYIKNEEYQEAISALEMATIHEKKKEKRIRYTYLLAQLNEQEGNAKDAVKFYQQVIKFNPPYEYSFKAKINMALSYSGADDSKIKSILMKMVKDEKNKEYLDQIYYALANLELNGGNLEEGKNFLKLSAINSVGNQNQKSQAYLRLGNIYFSEPEYFMAFAYYDSCVKVLPREFEDYDALVDKRNSLGELVSHYKVIQTEDSLQTLARMSEEERNKILDKIIDEYILKKEEEAEAKEQETLLALNDNSGGTGINNGNSWYFGNQSAIAQGRSEFLANFGDRPLEDNWRRADKSSSESFGGPDVADTGGDSEEQDFSQDAEAQREYYLKDLPLSDSAFAASTERILEAYFKLGMVYLEGLQDKVLALQTFNDLIKKSSSSPYDAQSRYILYRLNKQLGNSAESSAQSKVILSRYPESEYAKIITNPNYFEEQAEAKNAANRYYQQLYRWYQEEDYASVVNQGEQLYEKYKETDVAPRILFLVAMAKGTVLTESKFIKELVAVQAAHPKTSAADDARRVIDRINEKKDSDHKNKQKKFQEDSPYKLDKMDMHKCIVFLDSKQANINDFKGAIADFNKEYFKLLKISVKSIVWEGSVQMVMISGLPTAEKAEQYFQALKSEQFMSVVIDNEMEFILLSQGNLKTLMSRRDLDEYLQFFKISYRLAASE